MEDQIRIDPDRGVHEGLNLPLPSKPDSKQLHTSFDPNREESDRLPRRTQGLDSLRTAGIVRDPC